MGKGKSICFHIVKEGSGVLGGGSRIGWVTLGRGRRKLSGEVGVSVEYKD